MKDSVDLVVRNATLVTSSGRSPTDIAIDAERFAALAPRGELSVAGREEIDAAGLCALPGLIDAHVHFRSPGLEHEEDWLTGTRAAVFGGVTTVLDMPNTIPPTDTVARARRKLELAAAGALCDFGIFGLVGESIDDIGDLIGSDLVIGLKVFMAPTTGSLPTPSDHALQRALEAAAGAGMRVAFHAEDDTTLRRAAGHSARQDAEAHLESRPIQAEVTAIERAAAIVRGASARGHILHVSSIDGLAMVERWRGRGADLTCEVTPHHALVARDAYDRFGGLAKVNPPIRGEPHTSALLAALADGRIDTVASDHAPHLAQDKQRPSIWEVPAGIPGVETMLPLMLTEVAAGRLSIERLVRATSENPARAWDLWPRKGAVAVGSDADLTLVDLERPGTIRATELHGKNNSTPFDGRPTRGAVVATIVRGRVVMRDGGSVSPAGWGRRVERGPTA